jgi:hypothetical protein
MSADLLSKAASATPNALARVPHRWAALWPVYSTLRERGFSCRLAIEWLIKEKAIPEPDAAKALNAFHVLACRKRKRARRFAGGV